MCCIYTKFVVGFVGDRYYDITDMFPSMRSVSLDSTVSVPPAFISLHTFLDRFPAASDSFISLPSTWTFSGMSQRDRCLPCTFPSVTGFARGVTCINGKQHFAWQLAWNHPNPNKPPNPQKKACSNYPWLNGRKIYINIVAIYNATSGNLCQERVNEEGGVIAKKKKNQNIRSEKPEPN